jgi:uncharacterized protein
VIDRDEIARLTEHYGGQWGIQHTRRLLELMRRLGAGLTYDAQAVWLAAHLHDWGGYAPWAQKDVDHVQRSLQVVGPFLEERGCPPPLKALVMECIALHHQPGADRSVEAILLRDADVLDFLGVVGALRDFSKNPRDMRRAYDQTKQRRQSLPALLHLRVSKVIAADRLRHMDRLLRDFEAETAGAF